ncbi:MAG TPA: molybdenum ABC transporter ATP-binding protein [Terriglobales bacterium]|jgi:molybdate transport system ATP-binding protein|nr:molybdenum ABC transporter ATP-binding protein [Terriglobales bacterium]
MLEILATKRFADTERDFLLEAECICAPGITILFGASGAGKTTLLDCVAGLASPDAGRIAVGNRVFFDCEQGLNLAVQRRGVGYVFQDLALFPHLSAEENIGYGLSGKERTTRTDEILESFRIAHLRKRKPREISGGERQRVALARALVIDPCVLLLDEPLAALDAVTKAKMIDDLREWNRAHGIPIVYVTHSREEVFALGERVVVLEEGKIIAQGTPHEVMTAPRQESVAQLAGFENVFDAAVVAVLEYRGTMRCRLAGSKVELETPLVRVKSGSSQVRVGVRAGDILLATVHPQGLSARNVLPGRVLLLEERDMIVVARVDCGVEMTVHLTLAARDVLELQPGREVWLVIKTHSCHVMAK